LYHVKQSLPISSYYYNKKQHNTATTRCTDKALAVAPDNWPIPINTKKLILLSYLSYLFRLLLLSEDSYLLEGLQSTFSFGVDYVQCWGCPSTAAQCAKGLQSADKTKTHPTANLQNAPTFTRNGSHSHVCLCLV